MKILAIETSCDETAIALIEGKKGKFKILSSIVSSQIKVHQKWGGVVPFLAKREHQKNIVPVLKEALKKAGLLRKASKKDSMAKEEALEEILIREERLYKKLESFLINYQKPKVDAIAVTVGPGLEPALWAGVNFAKALSFIWGFPIISVNHIEAHILTNFFTSQITEKLFPAICLVVSGGHTQIILMRNIGNYAPRDILPLVEYKILGETRDDAAGECFDKVAKILGLGYPGGPIIAKLADEFKPEQKKEIKLPRPMLYTKDYDFSFSGLKTAVLYLVKQIAKSSKQLTISQKREIAFESQQAIIDVLIKKTMKAAKDYRAKSIILGGGVTANQELRRQFKEKIQKELPNTKYLIPDAKFCTDNAAMVAFTAYFHRSQTKNWSKIKVNANLKIENVENVTSA